MFHIIARIMQGTTVDGYKLIETETSAVKTMKADKLRKTFSFIKPVDAELKDGKIIGKLCNLSDYPSIDSESMKVTVNKIVILIKTGKDYLVTDATGKIRTVDFSTIDDCDRSKIANIKEFTEFEPNKVVKTVEKPVEKPVTVSTPEKVVEPFREKLLKIVGVAYNENPGVIIAKTNFKPVKDQIEQQIAKPYNTRLPGIQDEKIDDTVDKNEPAVEDNEVVEPLVADTNDVDFGSYELVVKTDNNIVSVEGIKPIEYAGIVDIPEGITNIGKEAFKYSCAKRINLPKSLRYLEDGAFSYTTLTDMELPLSVTAISHNCFLNSHLENINLEHVKSISNGSFSGTRIKSVVLKGGILQVGVGSFKGCKYLELFEHPVTLKKIREAAFQDCVALKEFDFTGISEIEAMAFYNTALAKAVINGEVSYVKPGTFSGPNLVEVEILDGCYKIADGSFLNTLRNPITYTIPKSVSNIGMKVLDKRDIVQCYYNSIAESSAKIAECQIIYLDDDRNMSKVMLKATAMGVNIPDMMSDCIDEAYTKDDVDYDFDLDETNLLDIELPAEVLRKLHISPIDKPFEYKEKPKFKVLLDHYRKVSPIDGFGLSTKMMKLSNTYSIEVTKIYSDAVSRILDLYYVDHKYESKNAHYIIALTGNFVRYCCFNNRYTDIYCNNEYSKDLSRLIKALSPGDTIGYDCTIGGKKYDSISSKAEILDKDGKKQKLDMNIYQALFNCSITVRLERNYLALILPANKKILKCASLGRAVWVNEKEESYKHKYCVVDDIQDLDGNTIIEYGVNSPVRDDRLFKEIKAMSDQEIDQRILDYATVSEANLSSYYTFRNYCNEHGMRTVSDLDLMGLGQLLAFPIVEERTDDWLDKAVGKTVVSAAKSQYVLRDGTEILQYKTVKRVAMKNKLLTGGDRTIFVYDVYGRNGRRLKIMASMLDIDNLMTQALQMSKMSKKKSRVYQDKSAFDVVPTEDVIMVATAFVNSQEGERGNKYNPLWLTVYKPNGLYYMSYIGQYRGSKVAVLLVQIGDFNIVTDYIDCANKSAASGYELLSRAGASAVAKHFGVRTFGRDTHHDSLLGIRNLVIDGETDISKYLAFGISPVVCHMMGVNNHDDSIYEFPEFKDAAVTPVEADEPEESTEDFELDIEDLDIDIDGEEDVEIEFGE